MGKENEKKKDRTLNLKKKKMQEMNKEKYIKIMGTRNVKTMLTPGKMAQIVKEMERD